MEFVSHHIKEILYVNTNSKGKTSHEIKTKRYTFSLVSDIDVEKSYFLYRVKISYQQCSTFSQFHEHFRSSRSQSSSKNVL